MNKFSTNAEFTRHMKYATGKCAQPKSVMKCNHCGSEFITKKALEHHVRMNPFCSALDDPLKTSLIGFKPSSQSCHDGSLGVESNESGIEMNEYSAIASNKRLHHDTTPYQSSGNSSFDVVVSPLCVPTKSARGNVDISKRPTVNFQDLPSLFFQKRLQSQSNEILTSHFVHIVGISNFRISVNVQYLLANPSIQMQPHETLLSHIILEKTRFRDMSVCAPLNIMVMEVTNTIACSVLDGSAYGMPGCTDASMKIGDAEVEAYLSRFSQVWVTKSFGANLTSPIVIEDEDGDQDTLVTIENFVDLASENDSEMESLEGNVETADSFDEGFDVHDPDVFNDDVPEEVNDVMDKVMNTFQDKINQSRMKSVYNANDLANIELYQMLQASGAPSYLFDQIQDWAAKHCSTILCRNGKKLERRKTFVKNMASKVYGAEFSSLLHPHVKKLELPSGNKIDVVLNSFKAQLVSLLTDYDLMKTENLLIDPNNTFGDVPDSTILSEINTGWWFKETRLELCQVPNRDILLPLIFFLDASNLDKNGRLQVNPLTFTLGIFNRSTRNKACAWRTMGYVDDLLNVDDKDVRKHQKTSDKAQDVHAIIDLVLQDFKSIQGKERGFEWTLTLNGVQHHVVFKLAVQVIIGDCKGNDLLCGRYGSHSLNVKRLCRDCNVESRHGDDHNHICKFLSRRDIENRSKENMNDLSFHLIENAFSDVCFGARDLCITEVTPPEPLHGFKLGICKYLFEGFERQCSNVTMRLVNFTAMRISRYSTRSSIRNLPSLQAFKRKGLSKCNSLSADEQYARIFALYLCLLVPDVFQSLATSDRKEKRMFENADGSESLRFVSIGPLGLIKAVEWLDLVSKTVLFNSWIMNPLHHRNDLELRHTRTVREPSIDREPLAMRKIRQYMNQFKIVVDRTHGNGLCIPKFHQLLHYVSQILKDGSLLNVDGGRCESISIVSHTNPGKRTQMRIESFMFQLAKCHHEDSVVNEASRNANIAYGKVITSHPHNRQAPIVGGTAISGSRFVISVVDETATFEDVVFDFVWLGKKPKLSYSTDVCKALAKRLWFNTRGINCVTKTSKVLGFTEFRRDEQLYRAHPSFRDSGEWYDWCTIEWDEAEDHVPCKILMFIDLRNSEFDDNMGHQVDDDMSDDPDLQYLKKDLYVLIQSCLEEYEDVEENSRYRRRDINCKRLRLEQSWRIVPCEAIRDPIFVIPEEVTQKDASVIDHYVINSKSDWRKFFLTS